MVTIHVANMACGGCAKGVLATLHEAAPGAEAIVNQERREISVAAADAALLLAALREAGWEAVQR
jgi:copper chaperone